MLLPWNIQNGDRQLRNKHQMIWNAEEYIYIDITLQCYYALSHPFLMSSADCPTESTLSQGFPVQELVQVESLAQMGVQLLLFALGLEFSLSKLRAVRAVALLGETLLLIFFATAGETEYISSDLLVSVLDSFILHSWRLIEPDLIRNSFVQSIWAKQSEILRLSHSQVWGFFREIFRGKGCIEWWYWTHYLWLPDRKKLLSSPAYTPKNFCGGIFN